ncbi:MAG: LamG-like jellyroll fold domain-containing protein [Phycisphaerae bacterium]
MMKWNGGDKLQHPGMTINDRYKFVRAGGFIKSGLISWWGLNEASGTRNDQHGSNHLTDNNTVTAATGLVVPNAASFASASTEYLSRADNADLSLASGSWTIAGWVRPTGLSADWAWVSKYQSTGNDKGFFAGYYQPSDRFYFVVSADGSATTNVFANNHGAPDNSTWVYYVIYHDAARGVIGIQIDNGTADESAYASGSIYDTATAFCLSGINLNTGLKFNGRMEQVGVWRRVLDDFEKSWLYNSGAGRSYRDLIGNLT